jgi:hypothetical protein
MILSIKRDLQYNNGSVATRKLQSVVYNREEGIEVHRAICISDIE